MHVDRRVNDIQNRWMRFSQDGVRGRDMARQLESLVGCSILI